MFRLFVLDENNNSIAKLSPEERSSLENVNFALYETYLAFADQGLKVSDLSERGWFYKYNHQRVFFFLVKNKNLSFEQAFVELEKMDDAQLSLMEEELQRYEERDLNKWQLDMIKYGSAKRCGLSYDDFRGREWFNSRLHVEAFGTLCGDLKSYPPQTAAARKILDELQPLDAMELSIIAGWYGPKWKFFLLSEKEMGAQHAAFRYLYKDLSIGIKAALDEIKDLTSAQLNYMVKHKLRRVHVEDRENLMLPPRQNDLFESLKTLLYEHNALKVVQQAAETDQVSTIAALIKSIDPYERERMKDKYLDSVLDITYAFCNDFSEALKMVLAAVYSENMIAILRHLMRGNLFGYGGDKAPELMRQAFKLVNHSKTAFDITFYAVTHNEVESLLEKIDQGTIGADDLKDYLIEAEVEAVKSRRRLM